MATQVPLKKEGSVSEKASSHQGMLAEMERLASSWMSPFHLFDRPFLHETLPRCDVIDHEHEIIVRVALPGFKKKDIEVSATDSTVTIQGKADEETEAGKQTGDYYRKEIRTESFMRMIQLPAVVEDQQANACFKEGLLEISLPKTKSGKRHTLEIND